MQKDLNNSFWLASQYSISLILSLVGLKLNLLTFGSDTFGIWILLLSLWGIGNAIDLGFSISAVKFIAQYKSDHQKVGKIVSTSLSLYQMLGIAIIVIMSVIAENFYFNNLKLFTRDTLSFSRMTFYFLAVNFYIQYVTIIIRASFDGHNDFLKTAKISLLSSGLLFLSIFFVYAFHLSLVSLSLFYIFCSLVQLIVYIISFRKTYPQLKIKLFFLDIQTFKEIFHFSFSIQITYLLGSMIDPIVKYCIGTFDNKSSIPTYEIAKKFALAISGLFSFAFRNILPKASILKTKEEFNSFLQSTAVRLPEYGIVFSALFYGVFSIFFAVLFKFFYMNDQALKIFLILSLAEIVNSIGYVFYVLTVGMGRAIFLVILQLFNITLTSGFLILTLVVFNSNLGLAGFFISVVLGNILMLIHLKRHIGLDYRIIFKGRIYPKLFCFISLLSVDVYILNKWSDAGVYLQVIVSFLTLILFLNEFKQYFDSIKKTAVSKFMV